MLNREVRMDTLGRQTRRLVLEEGRPVELAIALAGESRLVGNLYLARVRNVARGMGAAFVDIGGAKNAFLPLDDLPAALREAAGDTPLPPRPLKGGQEIIVQVLKEPGGDKGPRVTMNPSLPGRYAVLLPTVQAVGVSRHIQGEETRAALHAVGLAACPEGMGVILRTSAEEAAPEDITAEIQALAVQWQTIADAARTRPAPSLLWDDGDLAARAARDLGVTPVCGPFDPQLETRLAKDLRRKVWLDSGGYLVFDACEALTVIDVNSGKYAGKRSHGESLLRLNTEAAREIARQLRLRDIGGIIIIDFVDMDTDADRESVLSAFREALAADRAKSHIHGFTGAGLLELTRRPVYQPLRQAMDVPCPRCQGEGAVPSDETLAYEALRGIRTRRGGGDESEITLRVTPGVREIIEISGVPERVTLESSPEGGKT